MVAITAAFGIVFGLFCVALVGWAILLLRWAIRRDRSRRVSQAPDELT
jgi:hypothetical protein